MRKTSLNWNNVFFFFIVMSVGTASCKKQPEVIEGTIRGIVIDHVTKEPVQGARIFFRHRDKCPHEDFEDCWTVLDSTSYISDSLGKFIISYRIEAEYKPSNPYRLSAKPRKKGYFNLRLGDIGAFSPGRDTIAIPLWPVTCLRVRIIDENSDPERKYDGIKLNHTTFIPWDSIIQRPLDTTIIMVGDPFNFPSHGYNTLLWTLFYLDHPQIIGPISTIPQVHCPPHDTCDLEIRF
jgi:hypothetical protein